MARAFLPLVLFALFVILSLATVETPLHSDIVLDRSCVVTYFGKNETTAQIMKKMGWRVFRGEPYAATGGMDFANWMGAQGFRMIVLVRPTDGATTTTQDLQNRLNMIAEGATKGTTLIDAIEGPNEPNIMWGINHWSYNNQGWPEGLKPMQTDLWNMVKKDPELHKYPVLGPAWAQSAPISYAPGEFQNICTWGNYHPYPTNNCFQEPFRYNSLANYFCESSDPINTYGTNYAKVPYVYNQYIPVYGNLPLVMTETGYSTTRWGYTEEVQGKYIPRLLLENIIQGYQRSCIYQLKDSSSPPDPNNIEDNWGIIRWDGSLKPSGTAIGYLFNLLADPGANFSPVPLNLTITVTPVDSYTKTDFVHHLLLQKRNGDYYLVFWHEISLMKIFDASTRKPINPFTNISPPDLPTTVTLSRTINSATICSWDAKGVMTSQPGDISSDAHSISTAAQDRIRVIVFNVK